MAEREPEALASGCVMLESLPTHLVPASGTLLEVSASIQLQPMLELKRPFARQRFLSRGDLKKLLVQAFEYRFNKRSLIGAKEEILNNNTHPSDDGALACLDGKTAAICFSRKKRAGEESPAPL